MKKIYLLMVCLLAVIQVMAQNRTVSGTVYDKIGPLPGVSVIIAGTTNGAATDADGKFSIKNAPATGKLIFTLIGFNTRELVLDKKIVYNVTLEEEAQDLGEVVVVAFGVQKKPTVTGAIASVSGKELRQSPAANLTNALAGRLPGLFSQQNSGQPGKDAANLQIRGVSSFRGGTSPLFIVDGIQQESIGQIDMNEVENISILKDASATAVYGVKGANGVIIITTRRGKTGEPQVSFSAQSGVNMVNRMPKFLDSYNALTLLKESYVNDKIGANFPYSETDMEHFRSGDMPEVYPNVDWYKELMNKASVQTQYNANISGGTESVKYFVSAGYLDQGGIFKNFKESETDNGYYFKRYNFRSNVDINVNKNLDLTLDLSSQLQNVNQPHPREAGRSVFNQLMRLGAAPYSFPIYNPDGSYGAPVETNMHPNMVAQLTLAGYDRSYQTDLSTTVSATHKLDFLLKGLSAKAQMAFSNNQYSLKNLYRDDYPTYRYNATNASYLLWNPAAPVLRPYILSTGNQAPKTITDIQTSLNYTNTFGKHNLSVLALYNQNTKLVGSNRPISYLGYVGRMTYNYNHRYLLELNAGYNGSNSFNNQNHFGFFPAVSAGWVLSEEPFIKNHAKFIDFMKIRGSYGLVGNDDIGIALDTYAYLSTYVNSGSYSFGESNATYTGLAEGKIGNPNLNWEKERKSNIGFETQLFKSKLNITADYFDNYRYDIITTRATVGQIVGVTLPEMNMGKVSNKGFELEIGHNNNIGKVGYFLKANVAYAKNKVLERDEPQKAYDYLMATGQSVNQPFGWTAIGFWTAEELANANNARQTGVLSPGDIRYKDLNNDGVINDNDKGPIGNPIIPNTTFGFSAGANYNGFDFSFLLQGSRNSSLTLNSELVYDNLGKFQEFHLGRWTPETAATATYPTLHFSNGVNRVASSFWQYSGDYLRLKNVEIGYTLTPAVIKRVGIQSLRLYTNASNIFTWDKVKIVDPESPSGRGENYPQQRVFSFGLNANF
ncbi:SusC/RagA family TonB-linked outer membrane protein [Solitalea koreensis]|nr:TonB-dependent receptor [Solitalea koreensis]